MNCVQVMGRLTADPDLRTPQSGTAFCRLNIAVNRKRKNQQTGEYETDFIPCAAFGKTAEFIAKYFKKGQMIAVTGTLRTGSYQDKNHSDVTHYTTDVWIDNAEFCGSKQENSQSGNTADIGTNSNTAAADDDEAPF